MTISTRAFILGLAPKRDLRPRTDDDAVAVGQVLRWAMFGERPER
jgi:hypothetical protein